MNRFKSEAYYLSYIIMQYIFMNKVKIPCTNLQKRWLEICEMPYKYFSSERISFFYMFFSEKRIFFFCRLN